MCLDCVIDDYCVTILAVYVLPQNEIKVICSVLDHSQLVMVDEVCVWCHYLET